MADTLSRKIEFVTLKVIDPTTANRITTDICNLIKKNSKRDPFAIAIMKLIESGKSKYFFCEKWTPTNKRAMNICFESLKVETKIDAGMS